MLKRLKHEYFELLFSHYRLLFPHALTLPVQQKRIDILQTRITSLAWLLAFAMPAWSLLDAVVFPQEVWLSLLSARLFAGATFASFVLLGSAFFHNKTKSLVIIYFELALVFLVPTVFYVWCHSFAISAESPTPFGTAIINSYQFTPFVVLACVGLFPLTLVESLGVIAPLLMIYSLATHSESRLQSFPELGIEWVLGLLSAIAVVVSYSQLRMVILLINYSSHDILTDCLGRRSGEEVLRALRHYSVRKASHLTIALIDLDSFKAVNDVFGHHIGDEVLAKAAREIKAGLRKSDFVIRWGGDEFLAVLPDATIDDATHVLCQIGEKGLGTRPDGTEQTVSIGIAERISDREDDADFLVRVADGRLLQAKGGGKSRAVGKEVNVLKRVKKISKTAELTGERAIMPDDPAWLEDP